MKNRKTWIKTAIACVAISLTALIGMFSFLTVPAQAGERATETVRVSRLSDIGDGYDASLNGIVCKIEVSAY